MKKLFPLFLVLFILFSGCDPKVDADVVMKTDKGDIYLKLYDETPRHKENFLKLVGEGFYDGIEFHRVINEFMVQTGDPRTRENNPSEKDGPGYTIEAEVVKGMVHTQGKLAAARMPDKDNPNWESSGSQFYIVTGKKAEKTMLDNEEKNINNIYRGKAMQAFRALPENDYLNSIDFNQLYEDDPDSLQKLNQKMQLDFQAYLDSNFEAFAYTEEQRRIYMNTGGAPWLDAKYTIFGEVVKGIEVALEIQAVPTQGANKPVEPIRIKSMEKL